MKDDLKNYADNFVIPVLNGVEEVALYNFLESNRAFFKGFVGAYGQDGDAIMEKLKGAK